MVRTYDFVVYDGELGVCGRTVPKYTVKYEGFLFEGDSDGWNSHDTDSHDEAFGIANAYPGIVYVDDNEYGVTYHNGEWF